MRREIVIYALVIIHTHVREVTGSFSPIQAIVMELLGQAERLLFLHSESHTLCFLIYFLDVKAHLLIYAHTETHREHYRNYTNAVI